MKQEHFSITTPIYYVNDEPHLGHAYTTILADVLSRYARLRGQRPFFVTGSDEHGQKVQEAAQRQSVSPSTLADEMALRFKETWEHLHVDYDCFIRTTETRHKEVVGDVLRRLWAQGDIYLGEYEGWYCVPDERFWTEKDVKEGRCPDCGRALQKLSEPNYFFRMSQYQPWLIAYIRQHPSFIRPESRRNEVLGFLREPLGDLCISRPRSRLNWGIPLPFDPDYVTYVFFDALLNYVTAAGFGQDKSRFLRIWPDTIHLIGKDILMTHAVYWPTMLRACDLAQPRTIFAHGWWTVEGAKMSKSLGNVVTPLELAEIIGVDAFRYLLMREMTLGRDASFNQDTLLQRYQADLCNDLGNLLHRLVDMVARFCQGQVPEAGQTGPREDSLVRHFTELAQDVPERAEELEVNEALTLVSDAVTEINRYLERTQPWRLARTGQIEQTQTVLSCGLEALRICSVLLWPVMPERMAALWNRLGWKPSKDLSQALSWGRLRAGAEVKKGPPLFPRIAK